MADENIVLGTFNRGRVSSKVLARTELEGGRVKLGAEVMTNWMPGFLGFMSLRVGTEYIDRAVDGMEALHIPFIFAKDDVAVIAVTHQGMTIRVDDTEISRLSVSTVINNQAFNSDLSGWDDHDETGATSAWSADYSGSMLLIGSGYNAAVRSQLVAVASQDIGVEHAVKVTVSRGPVQFRIGSTLGGDEYRSEITLRTGEHSLAFTPAGDFYVQFSNRANVNKYVASCVVEGVGVVRLNHPWAEADMPYIRYTQSADVIFVACKGIRQRRIERYGIRSWSCVEYNADDGPFMVPNISRIQMAADNTSGNVGIATTAPYFKQEHVGGLVRLTSSGQNVGVVVAGAGQWSDHIKVTGVGNNRTVYYEISGTWTGTIKIQRSFGNTESWGDYTSFAANASNNFNDGFDNQIVYYRIGMDTGGYGSGSANATLGYAGGGITGIARITSFVNSQQVQAEVLKNFGDTDNTTVWSIGMWSDLNGYPSAVELDEGRLWWAGKDRILGSVSDAYESFDDTIEGDSGTISRSIGKGASDVVNWLLSLKRLIMGSQLQERAVQSSSLDEPLTPANFNLKTISTRGTSPVSPVRVDDEGVFVRGNRLFVLSSANDATGLGDYAAEDVTVIAPEIGESGFKRIVVQRYPDTRVHCLRNDGKVALLVYDRVEGIKCWVLYETDGLVKDMVVLPALDDSDEDRIRYVTNRTINGSTFRFYEKWSLETECLGGTITRLADCHVAWSGISSTVIPVAHLEDKQVSVWADGVDVGLHTVGSGTITLATPASLVIVGLPYTATYKSTKLDYATRIGTGLSQKGKISRIGFMLENTHIGGLRYGPSFDRLDDLPLVMQGVTMGANDIIAQSDEGAFSFPGEWSADSRMCLEAASPRPATVLAAVISLRKSEKI